MMSKLSIMIIMALLAFQVFQAIGHEEKEVRQVRQEPSNAEKKTKIFRRLVKLQRARIHPTAPCYLYDKKVELIEKLGEMKSKFSHKQTGEVSNEDITVAEAFIHEYKHGISCSRNSDCSEISQTCICQPFRYDPEKYPELPVTSDNLCVLPKDHACDAQSYTDFVCQTHQICSFDSDPTVLCTQANANHKQQVCGTILPDDVNCHCRNPMNIVSSTWENLDPTCEPGRSFLGGGNGNISRNFAVLAVLIIIIHANL